MSDPRTTPSIFTRGAVDLSALRAPAPAPSRPAGGPGSGQGAGSPSSSGPNAGSPNGGSPRSGGAGGGGQTAGGPDAGPGGLPGSETIIEVTEANFQTTVLERSLTTP